MKQKQPKKRKPVEKKVQASRNLAKDVQTPPGANNLQALQFVDGCVSQAQLSRQQHVQAQSALRQLSLALGELNGLRAEIKELKKKLN